jgi:hypothetical protein
MALNSLACRRPRRAHWDHIKAARGLRRFGLFCEFLADLAQCNDYRLLSTVQMQGARAMATRRSSRSMAWSTASLPTSWRSRSAMSEVAA